MWRAPIDNDAGGLATLGATWRTLGLDRMTHRLDDVRADGSALVVTTRVAPAARAFALRTVYWWTPVAGDAVQLALSVTPEGEWPADVWLPRLGVVLELPARYDHVTWFGRGPGESYPDSREAARVGRFHRGVDDLQTPYVFPQENGHRGDVRSAFVRAADGSGLAVDGTPVFGLTVRRWTTADLEAARHHVELRPRDRVYVTLDLAQHGLGSASCGPATLPEHRLGVGPAEFAVTLRHQRTPS